ncbi:hypothetical protein [Nocardia cyriacigeorgica]|uniref:Secreted protein n=1 Tax=Nocardia cyriacigeorgica TaxID=135487 RepID=A0A6P1DB05_9NOCA|nr:hypothetical protein [Nocardia cyriacigeorgica]NEW46751.1 hypothetical protein [Nocardia cyriacigeorgica]
MKKIALRSALATAAIAPILVLGAGVASAGPIIVPDTNPGAVRVGDPTYTEDWTCAVWGPWTMGVASFSQPVNPVATVGGFQAGAQVTGACIGDTIPWVAFINGTAG